MHRFLIFSSLLLLLIDPRRAIAHPGHGSEQLSGTPAHYLLDPFHAVWTIAMVAALAMLSRPGRRMVAGSMRSWYERPRSE